MTAIHVVDHPCAVVCLGAHDAVCRCRCGGENHGKEKREWAGHFCEGCGKHLGRSSSLYGVISTGMSKKYLTRFGKPAGANWCVGCYQQRFGAVA